MSADILIYYFPVITLRRVRVRELHKATKIFFRLGSHKDWLVAKFVLKAPMFLRHVSLPTQTFAHLPSCTGLLWNAMFINQHFNQTIIDMDSMTVVTHYFIDFGISAGNSQGNNYMMFNDPFMGTNSGCYLPGSAEGSGGVIKVLLEASSFIPDLMDGKSTYFKAIKNTLDYLVSIQLDDGNMPTYDGTGTCDQSYGNDSDARVQWYVLSPSIVCTRVGENWRGGCAKRKEDVAKMTTHARLVGTGDKLGFPSFFSARGFPTFR